MSEPKRILIVEDEFEWRENILREALEEEGRHIQTSASYQQASAILDQETFDLVIVDVNLAGVPGNRDGVRIVKRLTENENPPSVIIVSSSATLKAARDSLGMLEPVAFMDKTDFDLVDFIKTAADALS
jgi:DNA-binding response OmpR family regulator